MAGVPVAFACQSTIDGTPGPFGGAIDGRVHVFFGVFDDHVDQFWQYDMDLAALVIAATWAIDIRESDLDALNLVVTGTQGKIQTSFDVTTQGGGEVEITCLYINLHGASHNGLSMVRA